MTGTTTGGGNFAAGRLRQQLTEIREQLAEMVSLLHAVPLRQPVRRGRTRTGEDMLIWHVDDVLTVHTIAKPPGAPTDLHPPCVFLMAGRAMQWSPDWTALTAEDARNLAAALTAAADTLGRDR